MKKILWPLSRRQFVTSVGAASFFPLTTGPLASGAWAEQRHAAVKPVPELRGPEFHLTIDQQAVNFTGRQRQAITVNNSLPGPTLRMREGDTVTIHVTNKLAEDSSIHWHGIILPANMDGVPGISFDGIKPGETFTYQFTLQQSGTYWYHSHSGFQEALGLYGALIVEPKEPPPSQFDRDHIVMLSDWSDEYPGGIYANLKKQSHYYNTRERTLFDWFKDVDEQGISQTLSERHMWNQMRMSDSDIADVTGATYIYLVNGNIPATNWLGLFKPGERVRLRIINASSMSIFDVRIPDLPMVVVAADGQEVQPVTVDEFRIGTAETYDVIVEPKADAYTLFAQSIDRSGYTYGTLASDVNNQAIIPAMDHRPVLSHGDMGMAHGEHGGGGRDRHTVSENPNSVSENPNTSHANHGGQSHLQAQNTPMEHGDHGAGHQQATITHDDHGQTTTSTNNTLGLAGLGSNAPIVHAVSEFGPQVDMRAEMPRNGLTDPGIGLRDHTQRYGRRVLNYGDLRSYYSTRDKRQPSREIQLHLTGNMQRYMWSINGIKFAEAEPLRFTYGERLRIVLVNDTMMTHPIHLHGLWSELETGDPEFIPRKHTVLVQPGSTISYLVTADAEGRWAYHCHLLYHMAGMFREVQVVSKDETQHGGHHEHH